MEGLDPRIAHPIMDRTPRPIDRELAHIVWTAEGYTDKTFVEFEALSVGHSLDRSIGLTHASKTPNDHFWRLLVAEGQWYFQYTDYSPPETSQTAC